MSILEKIKFLLNRSDVHQYKQIVRTLGYYDKTASLDYPVLCTCPQKVFMYSNTNVNPNSTFIISPNGTEGRFIMKSNSGSAVGLTVITGNHSRVVGKFFKELSKIHLGDENKDVVVENDVWIGANVTLLSGVIIGRGATVGAGSVCVKSIPPYSVVMGNPAKVLGFNYTPEEVIEHEKALYPEEERIPIELLEKNYNKYFVNRIKEIKEHTRL